jgi:hypothetical protein
LSKCIVPILYSRKNALTVGKISSISDLADFIKSINSALVLDGLSITSVTPNWLFTMMFSSSSIIHFHNIVIYPNGQFSRQIHYFLSRLHFHFMLPIFTV